MDHQVAVGVVKARQHRLAVEIYHFDVAHVPTTLAKDMSVWAYLHDHSISQRHSLGYLLLIIHGEYGAIVVDGVDFSQLQIVIIEVGVFLLISVGLIHNRDGQVSKVFEVYVVGGHFEWKCGESK